MTLIAGYWVLSLTLLASLMLAVVPLPQPYQWFRPEWTAMVIVYWAFTSPGRVGVGVAWLAGLVLDGVQGVALGQNALGFVVIAYIANNLHQRMRHFAVVQQACLVFVLVGLHLLIGYWVQSLVSAPAKNLYFLGSALTSALLWPWFESVLRSSRRVFS